VKFFFDNNLAAKLAHGINEMVEPDHRVFHLRDKFPPNAEDVVWMQTLAAEEDWVIITADVRISRNPHEVRPGRKLDILYFF
jgi:predicted nuclease of predicted toxin-antitoxin system